MVGWTARRQEMGGGDAPGQGVGGCTSHPRSKQGPAYEAVLDKAVSAIDTQVFAKLKTGIDLKLLPMLTSEINSPVLGLIPVSCFFCCCCWRKIKALLI